MKRLFALLFAAVITVSSVLTASAATEMEQNAPSEINFSIQYKDAAAKMDGVVSNDEYYPLNLSSTYYNYYYDSTAPKTQLDDMKAFVKDDMKVYASWNAGYMYFALTAKAPRSDYMCNPDPIVYLFQHWCLQVAMSDLDVGTNDRTELGIGCNESTGKMLATHWGTRTNASLKENEDYAVVWDRESEVVTYELRLKFSENLKTNVTNGSSFRFSFLLGRGNGTGAGTNQIQLGKGIAFEKEVYLYPIVTLAGAPSDIPDVTEPLVTEAPQDPTDPNIGMLDKATDFRLPETMDMLDLKNDSMSAEYMSEDNGDSYVRLTANSDNPYIGGKNLTNNCNLDTVKTFAIRYRTKSEKAARLGVKLTSGVAPTLLNNEITFPLYQLVSDGEWHTIIFDMTGVPEWGQFATSFYLHPFDSATEVKGETIDIMWINFYTKPEIWFPDDTHNIYLDGEQAATLGSDTTDAPDEDTTVPENDDKKPGTDPADTDDGYPTETKTPVIVPIIIGVAAAVLVAAAIVVVIVIKKKKS